MGAAGRHGPAIPSRWILRLQTILKAAGHKPEDCILNPGGYGRRGLITPALFHLCLMASRSPGRRSKQGQDGSA